MRVQACGATSQRVPSEFKASKPDPWYEWLIHSRHAGDAVERRLVLGETERDADRVLAAAQLMPGMTLADIGSGEGLVPFKAIRNTGPVLRGRLRKRRIKHVSWGSGLQNAQSV